MNALDKCESFQLMQNEIIKQYDAIITCHNYALEDQSLDQIEELYKNDKASLVNSFKNTNPLDAHMYELKPTFD